MPAFVPGLRPLVLLALLILGLGTGATPAQAPQSEPPPLPPYPARVSDNGRYLLDQRGQPFFWLGDTAWELFHRLTPDEAERYLKDRASKGFTVIQAVVLAEYRGLTQPTPGGLLPLEANDPTRPREDYFQHVDTVVARANALGLVVGMLPTWGDKWNKKWGLGPEIFTPANARTYGEFVGKRYKDAAVVWILGGDRPVETDSQRAIVTSMAEGLASGDGGAHLMTFHPSGGRTSADPFGAAPWLDFNMIQSGHNYNNANYKAIAADHARSPAKPALDGEPGYEDHPAGFKRENGYLAAHDARKAAYWAVFAGALGHTYGCHDIWQFLDERRDPAVTFARTPWTEAIDLPGAGQMRHLRHLIESRPFLSRVPDQSLLATDPGRAGDHLQATRDAGGSYALIYDPSGRPFTVNLARLTGATLRATWFDPTTGLAQEFATFPRAGTREFTPPPVPNVPDRVLILDDVARDYPLLFR